MRVSGVWTVNTQQPPTRAAALQGALLNHLYGYDHSTMCFMLTLFPLQSAEFDIKKEAAWAISNATSGGTAEQIRYLVDVGAVRPLCDLLSVPDVRIVTVALEGLENILKVRCHVDHHSHFPFVVSPYYYYDIKFVDVITAVSFLQLSRHLIILSHSACTGIELSWLVISWFSRSRVAAAAAAPT
jgi:hypothetical protein